MKEKAGSYIAAFGAVLAAAGGMSMDADGYWIFLPIGLALTGIAFLWLGLNMVATDINDEYEDVLDKFPDDNKYKDELKEQEDWHDTYILAKRIEYRQQVKEELKNEK